MTVNAAAILQREMLQKSALYAEQVKTNSRRLNKTGKENEME
jgi:hypothetical protein